MKTLAVVANCGKARSRDVLSRLAGKAGELGLEVLAEGEPAEMLGCRLDCTRAGILERADAVIALGGDGTVLRAARELGGADIPILGVNIGGLGFLTSVSEADLDRALQCLAGDDFFTSARSVADCSVSGGTCAKAEYRALNEIVVESGNQRIISLDVSVNAEPVTSYVCDGLIISTPTGSTGHSLSAGGPILAPEAAAFVISLICPHTLSSRPLVVPDSGEISVRLTDSSGEAVLSADGQVSCTLEMGAEVTVKRSPADVRFIHLPGSSFYSVLRQKLHWRGSSLG
ncbi:MAG: NAD(+)/NADH kinase [Kiritimatiellia bacterium]